MFVLGALIVFWLSSGSCRILFGCFFICAGVLHLNKELRFQKKPTMSGSLFVLSSAFSMHIERGSVLFRMMAQ